MSGALTLWRKKLELLLTEEAKAFDGARTSSNSSKIITEAKAKITECESDATTATTHLFLVGFRADLSRILKYAPDKLIGRDDETKLLNEVSLTAFILGKLALNLRKNPAADATQTAQARREIFPDCIRASALTM